MPQAVAHGAAADPAAHCAHCGAAVEGTRHTRTDFMVGYYRLHGGPTEAATLALDDDATLAYRRLVRAIETVACPACITRPEVRRVRETWGEHFVPRGADVRGRARGSRPS